MGLEGPTSLGVEEPALTILMRTTLSGQVADGVPSHACCDPFCESLLLQAE